MSSWILDASAVLALLNSEPGHSQVAAALAEGARISSVNLAEVVAKLADAGMPEAVVREMLSPLGLDVVALDEALGYRTGLLRPVTRELGLSLGDRACLALAMESGCPVLTSDRAWAGVRLAIEIHILR